MATAKVYRWMVTGAILVGSLAITMFAEAGHGKRVFTARLNGFEEVPSISTAGHGRLWFRVSRDEQLIELVSLDVERAT